MQIATPTHDHLEFILKIYDTVTNSERWDDALDQFAYFCNADGASLMLGDRTHPEVSIRSLSKAFHTPSLVEEGGNLFAKDDGEALAVVLQHPPQTWITDEEAFGRSADEIPGNIWHRANWGLDRRLAACLNTNKIWIDAVSLNYKVGRVPNIDDGRENSHIFLPHIAKAIELSRPFLLLKERFNAILSVLDYLTIGIAITNRSGEVIAANIEAKSILESKNGISLNLSKKLQLSNGDRQRQLMTQIAAAVDAINPKGFEALIPCPKREGTLPWLVEVFPLGNLDGSIDRHFRGAAVFITDPEKKDIISTKGMQALFELTDAEAEVCALFAEGLSPNDIAESRNTNLSTVRGQIKTLYSKTGTSGHASLVRLALKVNLPVTRKEG
ncbi:MAG: helix-turn-helix transcriptional regulator [Sneathiella sp.]|nr:helix-turn-helix transcriptional regulator [Sneathiella sp.]